MQDQHDILHGSREGAALMANKDGNNGRLMRRFLNRASTDGVVRQIFAHQSFFTAAQLDEIETFAALLASQDAEFVLPEGGSLIGTTRNDAFGLVQNSYRLAHPVGTASVKQMHKMVKMVTVLYDSMYAYACNPNEVALHLHPDYRYRGLAISCSEEVWCISGVDNRGGGSGVLEWCYDEVDAQDRFEQMARHPRFENLIAESWASLHQPKPSRLDNLKAESRASRQPEQ